MIPPPTRPSREQATRVLIAEDDPLVRRTLRSATLAGGFLVAGEAGTGIEAVAQSYALKPDVILMDIGMPDLDGLEATRRIQAQSPTPTVIITAHQTPELLREAADCGAGAYLLKPPEPTELACSIAIAIARHADLMQMKSLARQRELLVREVYHRVTNQFGAMSALLTLQSQQARNPQARSSLLEAETRIRTLAGIHASLQPMACETAIPLGPYLATLCRDLITGLRPDLIFLEPLAQPSPTAPPATAIACGMLIHELVMNCIRHAFPPKTGGTIELSVFRTPANEIHLAVQDNGKGLPSGVHPDPCDSLGLMIVSSLASDLGGSFSITGTHPGTRCSVVFTPIPQESP